MSPLGLGSDLSISVRGPAAHTGIVGFKATHGRVPLTGHWPRVPPAASGTSGRWRAACDVALAYSLLAGPDGADGFSTSPLAVDAGVGAASFPTTATTAENALSTAVAAASRTEAVSRHKTRSRPIIQR
jgi:aspartyl-tRNA(Asn)/glutamyl-tRNA(Gln) amidotransferase subunit A